MQKINFNFDFKKATQALNFFALREGGNINKMKALKLIYLSDRYHLRKYGRLITNDIYYAMNKGPVPSVTKDIAEINDSYLEDVESSYASTYLKIEDLWQLRSIASLDNNVFSDSDIEAMSFTWDIFGHLDQFELAELAHDYPEWAKHKSELELDSISRVQMDINDFFDDPVRDIEKCWDLTDEERDTRKEQLQEMMQIESLWS